MTAPTSPFASTKQIAYLLLMLLPGRIEDPDFNDVDTNPSLTVVKQIRSMKSAEMMMKFASVGYKIPFVVLTGETWPSHQTDFLSLVEAMGTAGMLADSLSPAPAMMGESGPDSNKYTATFNEWLRTIDKSGAGLRADYHIGTRAEQWLVTPRAPTTEYTAGYPNNYEDPAKGGLLLENLSYLEKQYSDMTARNLDWDYVYRLRTLA